MIYDDSLPLVLAGPRLDEIEVTVREVDIGVWQEFCAANWEGVSANPHTEEEAARLATVIEIVAGSLVSWNLEQRDEDGSTVSVPCDLGGLRTRPKSLLMAILNAWGDAQLGIADPFELPSNDGAPMAEIPMESLAS